MPVKSVKVGIVQTLVGVLRVTCGGAALREKKQMGAQQANVPSYQAFASVVL